MTEPVNLDELDRWEALLLLEYKAAEEEDREGYLENWDEWRVVYTAGEEIRHLRAEVKRLQGELAFMLQVEEARQAAREGRGGTIDDVLKEMPKAAGGEHGR